MKAERVVCEIGGNEFLKSYLFYCSLKELFIYVCLYPIHPVYVGAEIGRECTIPKSWSYILAVVSCLTWVLGTEFRPLGNATSAPNCRQSLQPSLIALN